MRNSSYVNHYGFDESKIVVITQAFLNTYPTTYYFGSTVSFIVPKYRS